MSYYILKLDKSSEGFVQQLPAMLAIGAFEVVGEHDTLDDAHKAHMALVLADMKVRATGTPTNRHYEIADQVGKVLDWTGIYANRETLLDIYSPVQFAPGPSVLTAQRLKEIRLRLDLTQTEFGDYLGGSPLRTVQNWELGERAIPSTVVEILRLKGQL